MPLHILIIVENLPVPLDYRVWLIAKTLRDNGCKVSIISPAADKYPAGEFEIEGITVYRHNLPDAGSLLQYLWEYTVALWKEFRLSVKIFRKNKFKVIHACNPPDLIWSIGLFWKLFGVKFIYDHHDLSPEILLAKIGDCQSIYRGFNNKEKMPALRKPKSIVHRFAYKLLLINERISHKFANAVLVTNESFRKIALVRNKCKSNKIFVVRTGPQLAELPKVNFQQNITNDIPKIAYVGVMAKQDGVDVLLKSTAYAVKSLDKKFQLILMGGGPQFDNLIALAHKLGINKYVTFKGFIPRKEMLDELIKCSLGVTPDLSGPMNDFSTMLKVQDYMACGLPQVMFDLQENKFTAGESALYAKSGDEKEFANKIIKLIENYDLRKKLGGIARERVEKLTWENSGSRNLLKAYEFI
ncbi:MAG: glycosyltransferase WbuB [Chlamydiae bacterium]|nr:MAG: glycosyltransferase WbuB [Chlamydiota bacterium]